jgi:hypothetical protein
LGNHLHYAEFIAQKHPGIRKPPSSRCDASQLSKGRYRTGHVAVGGQLPLEQRMAVRHSTGLQ